MPLRNFTSHQLARCLEVAGLLISLNLFVLYLALAAGYSQTFANWSTKPGINFFEYTAVALLLTVGGFLVLLILGSLRKSLTTTLLRLLFLGLIFVQIIRIYFLSEHWPGWVHEYSAVLLVLSYLRVLLLPILAFLLILLGRERKE